MPILTGENLYTRQGFLPFILNQGCHIAQIDIPKAGGLLEAKKISDLADLYDMPVTSHNASSALGAVASAHARLPCAILRDKNSASAASMPSRAICHGGTSKAIPSKAGEDFIIHDDPLVKDGRILIPDKPGLGVEPDPEYLRAHSRPEKPGGDDDSNRCRHANSQANLFAVSSSHQRSLCRSRLAYCNGSSSCSRWSAATSPSSCIRPEGQRIFSAARVASPSPKWTVRSLDEAYPTLDETVRICS